MVLCTTVFKVLAELESRALELPDLRLLLVEHPIGGIEESEAHLRSAAASTAFVEWIASLR
jgi:hypothetical protein